jgi:hypothetical protein
VNTIWMMWANGDQNKSPEESILEAVVYYQEKYGVRPNRVQASLTFPEIEMEGILIERTQIVIVEHFLLTADEKLVMMEGGEV